MRPFVPILSNPYLLTVLGNFWPREYDVARYPMERRLIRTDEHTQVLVHTQRPAANPRARSLCSLGSRSSE